jgi:soluble lytic murein transglycosylase-like protein
MNIRSRNSTRGASGQLSRVVLCLAFGLATSAAATTSASRPVDGDLRNLLIKAVNDQRSFSDRYDAEVWLLDMSSRLAARVPDPAERIELLRTVHEEATRVNLPAELVLAVIEVESNFDRWAVSRAGAQGLMQVMPFWLKEIGDNDDSLQDPRTNLRLGCTILRYYVDKERGDLGQALARYNGRAGNREYPDRVFKVLRSRWYRR